MKIGPNLSQASGAKPIAFRQENSLTDEQWNPVIMDGRNVVEPDEFIEKEFVYKGIGRGDQNWHEIKR